MINYQKSVFDRLFSEESVELSKVDVELGVVQEIEQKTKKLGDSAGRIVGGVLDGVDRIDKSIASSKLDQEIKDLEKSLNEIKTKAKELGVDVSGMKEVNFAESYIDMISFFSKNIEKIKANSQAIRNLSRY